MTPKFTLTLLSVTAMLGLTGCATTSASTAAPVAATQTAEAETMNDVADKLTQTKTTAKSADGKLICKRTSVVGSNFKRKICATAEQWEAEAEEAKKKVGDIQRRGAGPGVNN